MVYRGSNRLRGEGVTGWAPKTRSKLQLILLRSWPAEVFEPDLPGRRVWSVQGRREERDSQRCAAQSGPRGAGDRVPLRRGTCGAPPGTVSLSRGPGGAPGRLSRGEGGGGAWWYLGLGGTLHPKRSLVLELDRRVLRPWKGKGTKWRLWKGWGTRSHAQPAGMWSRRTVEPAGMWSRRMVEPARLQHQSGITHTVVSRTFIAFFTRHW